MRIRQWPFGVALALLAAAFFLRASLLERAGRFLIEEQDPARADAILVLAGSVPDRSLEAVALYREGYARTIVFSRPPEEPAFKKLKEMGVRLPWGSALARSIAEQLGVPPGDIVEVGGAAPSTFTEAEVLLRFAAEQGYRTILLVTSKTHSWRAALIFRHLAGKSFTIITRPSRYDDFQPESWWQDRISQRHVVFEYQKLAVFYLIDRWQHHQAPVPAGAAAGNFLADR